MELLEEYKEYKIFAEVDEFPQSPREWDNLGTMACWHRDYLLGDEEPQKQEPAHYLYDVLTGVFPDWDIPEQWNENGMGDQEFIEEALAKLKEGAVVFPLVLLDHSGLWMRVGNSFAEDPGGWDTSRVGFIFVTKEKIEKEFGDSDSTAIAKAVLILTEEVNVYSQYLEGDVWGFIIEDENEDHVDSCREYYGHDFEGNGLLDTARNSVDCEIENREKEMIEAQEKEVGL